MARTVSTETRHDLLQAVRERYRGSLKDEKLRILDEFVAITGYHRKHIIRLFNAAPVASGVGRRRRLPVYDEAVREALIVLWEAAGPDPIRWTGWLSRLATASVQRVSVIRRRKSMGARWRAHRA